jgi:hypothetical protein
MEIDIFPMRGVTSYRFCDLYNNFLAVLPPLSKTEIQPSVYHLETLETLFIIYVFLQLLWKFLGCGTDIILFHHIHSYDEMCEVTVVRGRVYCTLFWDCTTT